MDKKASGLRCALTVALLGAAQCFAGELTIGVSPSLLSLPIEVAQTLGYFAAEGVTVRVAECATGPRCMQKLFDRDVQLTTATDMPVVMHSFERSDFAVVATLATSTGNIRLLSRRSAGIAGPEQLAGKRIGVIAGTSAQYYLDTFLYFHGIDPQQVKVVPLLPETIAAAIDSRQIDALAGFSRQTGPALKSLGGDGVLLAEPRIYTETYNLVAERGTLTQRQGDVVKVLRALQQAEAYIAANPQQAMTRLLLRTKLDPEFLASVWPGFSYRLSLDQSLVSTMEGVARWARRGGHVASNARIPNYLGFVDAGPLRAAVPAAIAK